MPDVLDYVSQIYVGMYLWMSHKYVVKYQILENENLTWKSILPHCGLPISKQARSDTILLENGS